MRRFVILATVLTLGLVGLVAGNATPQGPCTEEGSPGRDVIAGTPHRDVICAEGDKDYVSGLAGPDVLIGDGGRDTMVGGPGADRLYGSGGRDNLFAVDGSANDVISGGAGRDRCFADRGDVVRGCGATFRGASLTLARRLSAAFGAQAVVAEELISVTPTPIPPPPIVTVTVPGNCGGHPAPPPIC